MNPVFKIVTSAIIWINRQLDSLSFQTVETIRRAFYFLMFIFVITGIMIGYNMGVDSAKIKSPPIAEFIDDAFRIKVSRERGGDFSGMLEAEILKDSGINSLSRYEFPVRVNDSPEVEKRVIEPDSLLPQINTLPGSLRTDRPIEYDEMEKSAEKSPLVKPIERDYKSDTGSGIIINRDNEPVSGVRKTESGSIKLLPESGSAKPDVLKDEEGVIER